MMKLEKFTVSDTESDELVEVDVDVPENSAEKSLPADLVLQKAESRGRRKKTVQLEEESDKHSEDSQAATSASNASGVSLGEAESSNDNNDEGDQLQDLKRSSVQNDDQVVEVVEPNFRYSSKSQLTKEAKSKEKESAEKIKAVPNPTVKMSIEKTAPTVVNESQRKGKSEVVVIQEGQKTSNASAGNTVFKLPGKKVQHD
jgi:hypothetical protein